MAIVNELVTKFSFQGDPNKLEKYNETLNASIKGLATIGAAAFAGAAAFGKFVQSVSASLDPLVQLSRTTDTNIEALQELGFVASQNGSSLQAVTRTAETFGARIGEAAQRGSEEFSRLGISVRDANGNVKTTEALLFEVGRRFKEMGLSAEEQISFANKLGIDKTLLQTLRLSSNEIDTLRSKARALGVVTQKEADSIASMNDSLTVLRFGFDAVSNKIAVGFAPVLKDLAERFTDFLIVNKDLIANGLVKLGEIFTATSQAIVRLAPFIAALGLGFLAAKVYILGFGKALALIFSPVNLIIAGVVALLFIVDDLIVAFRGGNSVIANFFDGIIGKEGATQAFLQRFVDGFKAMLGTIKEVGKFIFDIFAFMANQLSTVLNPIIDAYNFVTRSNVQKFSPIEYQSKLLGGGIEDKADNYYNQNTAMPNLFGTGGSSSTSNTVTQDVKIEIRTDDPTTAGQSVRDGLNNQLEDAQYQFKRGGR